MAQVIGGYDGAVHLVAGQWVWAGYFHDMRSGLQHLFRYTSAQKPPLGSLWEGEVRGVDESLEAHAVLTALIAALPKVQDPARKAFWVQGRKGVLAHGKPAEQEPHEGQIQVHRPFQGLPMQQREAEDAPQESELREVIRH